MSDNTANDSTKVRVERAGGLMILTLDRPAKLNAITYVTIGELLEYIEVARTDDTVRAILLRGAGPRAFCAGDDVASLGKPPYPVPPGDHPIRHMQQRLIRAWFWHPKPTIVAIHGRCHGIACDIALSADFRLVSEDVIYGDLRSRRALPVGSGATWLLPRLIGLSRATKMMLTGGTIDATQMDAYGLATEVLPAEDFAASAQSWALQIACGPTKAMSILKRELRHNLTVSFEEGLEYEMTWLDEPVEDRIEGVRSFRGGRDPVYTGR